MASINLVTGYTGTAHIKSEEDALLNRFLLGQNNAVINLTDTFNANSAVIDCDAIVNGRLMRTDGDVTLEFTTPSSGYYRYDGIYLVYKKLTSGIESAELVYCEGAENVAQAAAEAAIGTPTIGSDVDSYALLQLFTVAWDNAQTKTVTGNATKYPTKTPFILRDLEYQGHADVTIFADTIPLADGIKLHTLNWQDSNYKSMPWDTILYWAVIPPDGKTILGANGQALVGSSTGFPMFITNYQFGTGALSLFVRTDDFQGKPEDLSSLRISAMIITQDA